MEIAQCDFFNSYCMIIMEHCGGATGPIWGSAFRAAGKSIEGKEFLTVTIFALMLQAAVKGILAEFIYVETVRKCTVSTILKYLLSAATNEWKSWRHAADVGPSNRLISVDHSSLSKHLKVLDYGIIKRIFDVIIAKLNLAARRRLNLHKNSYFPLKKNWNTYTLFWYLFGLIFNQ